jgi:streptogramin lyase
MRLSTLVVESLIEGLVVIVVVSAIAISVGADAAKAAQLEIGDIVVADAGAEAIVRVDPDNGEQTIVASSAGLQLLQFVAIDESSDALFLLDGTEIVQLDPSTGEQTVIATGLGSNPGGLVVDANGDFIVTDLFTITRVDAETGEQTTVSSDGHLGVPLGIAIDANGDLIVSNGRFSRSFRGILRVDLTTGEQTIVSQDGLLCEPNGIAIEDEGDILVAVGADSPASCPEGPGVIRVNPTSGEQTVVTRAGDLNRPRQMVIDADGDLLVTNETPGSIVRVDPETGAQAVVSACANLSYVRGIALDAIGDPIVAGHLLVRVDPHGGAQTVLVPRLDGMAGIAVDGRGRLIVTNEILNSVVRLDPVAETQTTIASFSCGPMDVPQGLAVELNGDLVVSSNLSEELGGDRGLLRVDPETGDQSLVSEEGTYRPAYEIAVEANGNLLFTSLTAIIRVDSETGVQTIVSADGYLLGPRGIAVEADGNILVGTLQGPPDKPSALRSDLQDGQPAILRLHPETGDPARKSGLIRES